MIGRAKPQTTAAAEKYTKIHNRAREISKHRNLCYHDTQHSSLRNNVAALIFLSLEFRTQKTRRMRINNRKIGKREMPLKFGL